MRKIIVIVIAVGFVALATSVRGGESPEITSFTRRGELTFTGHPFGTNHTVEWISSLSGTWTNSWDDLRNIVPTGQTHTVRVPMFFRVVCDTAPYDLQARLTVDNRFWLYISTNETKQGTLIASKTVDNYDYLVVVLNPIPLTPGVTNYVHIKAQDMGVIAGLLGEFYLNSDAFRFPNGENYIVSCANGWRVSRTGFGLSGEVPAEVSTNRQEDFVHGRNWQEIKGISRDAMWIWTNSQFDTRVTRYFSLPIIPVQ